MTPTTTATRLSIAHTPNVHRHNNKSNNDEEQDSTPTETVSSSSSSSSWLPFSNEEPYEEVDWLTIIDPPHEEPPLSNSKVHDPLTVQDWQTIGVTVASLTAFMSVLMKFSGPGAWRYYLAGGVCAAVSHAIPVPIDVIKTRKQVDPLYCNLSMPQATRKLMETEGLSALFVGMGPTVWGYFLEGAVKFGVYEILKPWIALLLPNSQFLSFCACAAVSGLAAGIMLCPMEALRIRLVAEPRYAAQGWIRGGLRMLRAESGAGLTRGLTPMLYKQIPYTITKNVSFDFLTKFLYKTTATSAGSLVIPFVAAAAASVLSCLSSQPGDMLLSVVNAHEGERRRTRDVMKQIFHSDRGVRGFFVGVKTRFLHVGMIVTVQLLIYDFVKRLAGIAATGSV